MLQSSALPAASPRTPARAPPSWHGRREEEALVVVVRDAVPVRARPEVPLGADLPHHAGDHQQRRDDAQHRRVRRALRMRERRRGGGGHRRWIRSSLASSSPPLSFLMDRA
jgi:hypothetical protein